MTKKLPNLMDQMLTLVSTPSVSSLDPSWDMSNQAVIDTLAEWFALLGFKTEIQPLSQPGKFNLIASLGTGPGGLVLAGHTDTVPFNEERWKTNPLSITEKDHRLYGLGTADMKGFFPVILQALQQLDLSKIQRPLFILATADEESSMAGARALVEAGIPKARRAIIGEPTGLRPIRMHKGFYAYAVKLTGVSGHSSNPDLGANALDCMHEVLGLLKQFRIELAERYQQPAFEVAVPTMNLGCIHGGDNPNRICGQCELQFDFRPLPGMKVDPLMAELKQRIEPITAAHQQQFDMVKLYPGVPAFQSNDQTDLLATAERLSGYGGEAVAFATEAPFLAELGMDTIVMGAGSIDQAHQPDEYLDLDSIPKMVDILCAMVQQYCINPSD